MSVVVVGVVGGNFRTSSNLERHVFVDVAPAVHTAAGARAMQSVSVAHGPRSPTQ